jgi:hypothetical protein
MAFPPSQGKAGTEAENCNPSKIYLWFIRAAEGIYSAFITDMVEAQQGTSGPYL